MGKKTSGEIYKIAKRIAKDTALPKITTTLGSNKKYLEDVSNANIIMYRLPTAQWIETSKRDRECKVRCSMHAAKLRLNKLFKKNPRFNAIKRNINNETPF